MIASDLNHSVIVDYNGLQEHNVSDKEHNEHSLFGITCCGASISLNQDLSMIGDFFGNIRVFDTSNGQPQLLWTLNLEDGIRYVHFHDFINSFGLVGSMDGTLRAVMIGEEIKVEAIYAGGHTITNIRTALTEKEGEYYIILGDTYGYLHILRGKADDPTSYKLVTKIQAHQPSEEEFNNKFGSL